MQNREFRYEVLRQMRQAVHAADAMQPLAYRLHEELGWRGEPATWLSLTSHMLSGRTRHFPVTMLPLVYEVTGQDVVSGLLAMEHLRLRLEQEKRSAR